MTRGRAQTGKRQRRFWRNPFEGDTLIEVTFSLAILSAVVVGATVACTAAFRMGQTAKERILMINVAQEQMEALRSFRDNHTWGEFASAFTGLAAVPCSFDPASKCFHMERLGSASVTEWLPMAGMVVSGLAVTGVDLPVPAGRLGISRTPATACTYDFVVDYSFEQQGGGTAGNHIKTRLTDAQSKGGVCS